MQHPLPTSEPDEFNIGDIRFLSTNPGLTADTLGNTTFQTVHDLWIQDPERGWLRGFGTGGGRPPRLYFGVPESSDVVVFDPATRTLSRSTHMNRRFASSLPPGKEQTQPAPTVTEPGTQTTPKTSSGTPTAGAQEFQDAQGNRFITTDPSVTSLSQVDYRKAPKVWLWRDGQWLKGWGATVEDVYFGIPGTNKSVHVSRRDGSSGHSTGTSTHGESSPPVVAQREEAPSRSIEEAPSGEKLVPPPRDADETPVPLPGNSDLVVGRELEETENLYAAREKIAKLAQQSNDQLPLVAKWYAEYLSRGLEDGTVYEKLASLLKGYSAGDITKEIESNPEGELAKALNGLSPLAYGEENFTNAELEAVFGESFYSALNKEEQRQIAMEYHASRWKTRDALLRAIQAELGKSSDPRDNALAKAVEGVYPTFREAYAIAIERVKEAKRDDGQLITPICFTCGEHNFFENESVSHREAYGFETEMDRIALSVTVAQHLASADDESGPATAFFNPGSFSRLSTGQIVKTQITDNGELLAYTTDPNGEFEARRMLGQDERLSKSVRDYYQEVKKDGWPSTWNQNTIKMVEALLTRTDPNAPPKPPTALAVPRTVPEQPPQRRTAATVPSYIESVKTLNQSQLAQKFPTPEKVAEAVGLVDPDGRPYVTRGSYYGVYIDWTRIRAQSAAEQQRVQQIFREIAGSRITYFKVETRAGVIGHCLYCHLKTQGW